MPLPHQSAEDFVQVNLGAASPGILAILPVGDDEFQAFSWSRVFINASSTPLTKRGLSWVLYFSANSIAS